MSLDGRASPDWWTEAVCRNERLGVDAFFDPDHTVIRACRTCPVRLACLQTGLNEQYGVWGGYLPGQRRRIRAMLHTGSSLLEAIDQIDEWRNKRGR